MKPTHIINLNPDEELEEYEKDDSNLVSVKVDIKADSAAQNLGKGCRVKIYLSSSAMIGLGTSLIRLGLSSQKCNDQNDSFEPIVPTTTMSPSYNSMGFLLVPDSADVMFCLNEFGTLTKVIEEFEKKDKL